MENILTIAIPVFNRSRFLKEALESALNQTLPTRVIVVDNASTAFDFETFVNSYQCPRLKYHRNPSNLGVVGNWNRCVELCTTPYILILHDDDRLELSYSARIWEVIESNPSIIVCRTNTMDEKGSPLLTWPTDDLDKYDQIEHWVSFNPWPAGYVFSVRSAVALGGFRPELKLTPDFDMWFRLALNGKHIFIREIMAWYRIYNAPDRATSILNQNHRELKSLIRIYSQVKRNKAGLMRVQPEKVPLIPPLEYFSSLRLLMQSLPHLSRWQRNYALAIFVRSKCTTVGSKTLRVLFRIAGKPLCKILKAITCLRLRLRKSAPQGAHQHS